MYCKEKMDVDKLADSERINGATKVQASWNNIARRVFYSLLCLFGVVDR